jgi:ABC-type antimicrobial peptide transport system permease subunit
MNKPHVQPPRWIFRFLHAFCPENLAEEIEGDLHQKFYRHVGRYGENKARRKLYWCVLKFFRPGILLRNNISVDIKNLAMLTNYLRVALRVMLRSKTFSIINVAGLTIGISGALLLFLWVKQEVGFDRFHKRGDRLYVAWNRAVENGQINCWPTTPRVLAPTLKEEYPSVEYAVSYADWEPNHLFTAGNKKLVKTSGIFADPGFLSMLSFPLLYGNPDLAMNEPNGIVITEGFARQLFGKADVLGEQLTISDSGRQFDFLVSGVLKDLPANTGFKFEYLISFRFLESLGENDTFWGNNSVTTLVALNEDADLSTVNDQIKDIEKRHYPDGQHIEIFLYPLSKMRLYSRFENGVAAGGRIEVVRLLIMLGISLVVVAGINFVNLSTARAQKRSKEVAVRKVTGAVRRSLITQFLLESVVIAGISGVISVGLSYVLLPYFNLLVGENLSWDFGQVQFWLSVAGAIFLVGLLAGGYPALYLSSFRPVRILKGMKVGTKNGSTMRASLVVFQFGFAMTLIVSAIVIYNQISYLQQRDAGYTMDNLVYLPLNGDLSKNYQAFKNELIEEGSALSVTKASTTLTQQWSGTTGMSWRGKRPNDKTDIQRIYVDEGLSKTSRLTILQGRDMDLQAFPSDSSAAIINETALKVMGFENPIGETVTDNGREWNIIGVVKDFVFTSPYHQVEPIVLFGSRVKWAFSFVYVKLNPDHNTTDNLAALRDATVKYNPEYPFEFQFADVVYRRKFDDLTSTLNIAAVFTGIAIGIACLGLWGLSIFMTEARVKEIGIRKVLGGSVMNITRLLGYASLKPIIIAIVLFMPLAWLAMERWLKTFAYRIDVDAWTIFWSALLIFLIAAVTISVQTIRAARSNPVVSLRNE